MPRRKTFTVDAESVQGNEGAEVTFHAVKVRGWKEYRTDPEVTDATMLQRHIVSWAGFIDDDDNELPNPSDEPSVLGDLYVHEQQELTRLLWQGPDGTSAKN